MAENCALQKQLNWYSHTNWHSLIYFIYGSFFKLLFFDTLWRDIITLSWNRFLSRGLVLTDSKKYIFQVIVREQPFSVYNVKLYTKTNTEDEICFFFNFSYRTWINKYYSMHLMRHAVKLLSYVTVLMSVLSSNNRFLMNFK